MRPAERFLTDDFMRSLAAGNPGETEFHQAVARVLPSLVPVLEHHTRYLDHRILERLVEPERVILFRVPWIDDRGEIQVNKGFRVQFSSTLGPYQGGLTFHSTVTLGILKSMGFEQIFRNSLTTLPMGGGGGGSDFDPKGRSDNEVMRFCQSFMTELARHISPETDIVCGGIGVGGREIGYLFGQSKRLRNAFEGVATGKGLKWGGTLLRPEATGYGVVYFAEEMLNMKGESLDGKRVAISGSGTVAQAAAEKSLAHDAKVVTLSDSSGFVIIENGATREIWEEAVNLKTIRRGRIGELAETFPGITHHQGSGVWEVPCDVALPCATQSELNGDDATILIENGCTCIVEGANLPSTTRAQEVFSKAKVLYAPGKVSNIGSAVLSGLEMSQNRMSLQWTREETDTRLREIMIRIHETCATAAADHGLPGNYVAGADIAAFVRVADGMIDLGLV